MSLVNNFIQTMKSTLKIVLVLLAIQLSMQAGFDCSVSGCALCTYPDTCGQCNNNWLLMQNSTTGAFYCSPVTCAANCATCYVDNTCQVCNSGFFLTSTGSCSSTQTSNTSLPAYCSWGYGSENCTLCMYGYTLQEGFCYPTISKSYQDMYCMIKMTPSMCQICKSGYIVNTLGMCVMSQVNETCLASNCAYCQNANNTCTMCEPGYQLTSGNTCETLPCNITGCDVCTNSTACKTCRQGYVSTSSNTCQAAQYGCNVANCAECGLAFQSCSLCNVGYQLAPFTVGSNTVNWCTKITCPYNVTNCMACVYHYNQIYMFNQVMCDPNSCMSGYIHVNGYCVANVTSVQFTCTVQWCNNCNFNNFCASCMLGYTLTSYGTCQPAYCNVENCATCNLNNICSSCMAGYTLTGNLAMAAESSMLDFAYSLKTQCTLTSTISCNINWCTYCSSNNVCAGCMPGYDFNSNNTMCVPNCNVSSCYQCNEGQDKTCNTCNPGYTLSSDQLTCTPMAVDCGTGCGNATSNCVYNWVTNTSQCMQCMTGYTLYNGMCYEQTCSLFGCAVCENWNTPVTCAQCQQGLFPTQNGYCIQLNCESTTANCANCIENGMCLGCKEGFYLQNSSGTVTCVNASSISSCSVDNCLACASGSTTTCQTCAEPYVVNPTTGMCTCKWQNCLDCSFSAFACSACTPNLIATIKDPSCIPFPSLKHTCSVANCEMCVTPNMCSICAVGYSLNYNNGSCQINSCSSLSNCQLCDQYQYECFLCNTGYQVDNTIEGGSCFQISANYTCSIEGCGVCSYSNNSMCASCLPYYHMVNGTCVANECDFPNCLLCLENNFCTACTAGFTLNTNGQCMAISPSIAACTSNIAFCQMCMKYTSNNTETCYQCLAGFEYDSTANSCVPQSNSIMYCKYQTNNMYGLPTCLVCTQGYYINSWGTCSMYSPTLANTGCSVYNCLHCSSNNTCSFCFIPWGISTSGTCQTNNTDICQDSNCNYCANSTFCYTCVSTYRPYLGSCLSCDISGCDYCQNAGVCSSCMDNYDLLTNGLCVSCDITNCVTCSDNNICQTCSNSTGVTLMPSSTRDQCVQCTNANCAYCSSTNSCGVCDNGYQLWPMSGNSTQNCITCDVSNCNTCNSNNFCYICASGYSVTSNGTCVSCNSPCATCNSDGSCATCKTPFYAATPGSNGNCFVSTVPNCNQYNASATTTCLGCTGGYTINTTSNTCVQNCASSCLTCSSTNSTQCLTCAGGLYLTSSNKCMPCSDSGCSNCTTNTSSCTTCFTGFYLLNGECKSCPSYCQSCTSATSCSTLNNNNGQTLQTVNGNTILAVCNQGCATCSSFNPQICIQCSSGYYLMNGVCMLCSSTCKTCSSTAPDQCSTCYPNAFLSGTTCTACSGSCLTCQSANNPEVCTSCRQGSYLSGSTCVQGCPTNCLSCSSQNTCTQCVSGYTLFAQNTQTLCASCISSCRTCAKGQPANCLSCGDGFYLNNGACVACIPQCQSCTSVGCTSCISGYFLATPQICSVQCNLPCATCSSSNPNKCYTCIAGYSYSSTSLTCNKILTCGGACSACPMGYSLSAGQCTQCTGNNCQSCSATALSQCQSCMIGYYLNSTNNQCVSCPSSCATCQSADGCLTCKSGFTMTATSSTGTNGYTCSPCVSPCATCVNSPNYCTTCVSGFSFNGWKCVQNFHFAFTITLQTTQATFNTNYFSFLLALAQSLGATNINVVTIFSISFGSVIVSGAANPSAQSATKSANSQFSSLDATVANNNQIAGMTIVDSSVTVNGGTIDYDDVDLALILGICIPVGILLIVGIALFVYCKKKKSSDIIEQRIKQDSGFTVRESFELSNQYKDQNNTARGFEQDTAIN